MLNLSSEKVLAKIIAVGSAFTTIFVMSGSVTDPVNVTKLLSLGIVASLAFGILVSGRLNKYISSNRAIWLFVCIFLLSGVASTLASNSPLTQNIYGSYGRNNGLLAYFFLAAILLSATVLSIRTSIKWIIYAFFTAGFVNIFYCLWVIAFGDFIGWSNPYGNILGTFGNPNFIGAFLGMFFAAFAGFAIAKGTDKRIKYAALVVLPITAFEIYDSSAIQGRVVGLGGLGIVGFFYVKSKFGTIATYLYSVVCTVFGLFGVLGALQIGPLTSVIYKNSVSLRGQYWLAGWNTGQSNPLTGSGMDSFGDWYRRSRDSHALELPGVNTVVNAAHNVPLDMFAFGGWPLFLSYLFIMLLGAMALLKIIKRTKDYDKYLVVIVVAWVGYQVQSIISINQIGLAIWGWVLTGVAIAYERITKFESDPLNLSNAKKISSSSSNLPSKSLLSSAIFGLVGLIAVLPPFIADTKWRSAQISRDLSALELTMERSIFNPPNTNKYLLNIQLLEQSNFPDLAHKYALQAVEWNPESFDLWKILFLLSKTTIEERETAKLNMQRLDPLNPDVTSIK